MAFMGIGKQSSGKLMMENKSISVAVLTVSDRSSQGLRDDKSGPIIIDFLNENNFENLDYKIVPDEKDKIIEQISKWIQRGIQLVFTTGGTGFAPRDITPETTALIIDRETPGISEYLRFRSFQITPHATLSRGISGIKDNTLIINLPGSPKAARECVEFLLPIIPHAIELIVESPDSEKNH